MPAATSAEPRLPYFAYGSNLDRAQMRARCPAAKLVCRAKLAGYRLAFAGASHTWGGAAVATLVPARGASVHGVLYSLTAKCFERLDAFEGHPDVYIRVRVRIVDDAGSRRYAQTYALPLMPEGSPSPKYLERIVRAYTRHGFELTPLFDAALRGAA